MTREEYVTTLRQLADFFEAHDVPHPAVVDGEVHINVWTDVAELAQVARKLSFVEKVGEGEFFNLRKRVSPQLVIDFFNYRAAVCTKRVVGTETVTEKVAATWEEKVIERDRGLKLRGDAQLGFSGWLIHSTAAQRAEAFLRTLNLWKDEQ